MQNKSFTLEIMLREIEKCTRTSIVVDHPKPKKNKNIYTYAFSIDYYYRYYI